MNKSKFDRCLRINDNVAKVAGQLSSRMSKGISSINASYTGREERDLNCKRFI